MKRLYNFFSGPTSLSGRVLVNMGALASANLWRIVVSFLLQLTVARTLGLDALGQYTVAMAYLNITQTLCELGLPLWMVRKLAPAPLLRAAYFWRSLVLQVAAALLLWGLLAVLLPWLPYPPSTRTALFWVGASLPLFAVTSATATIFQAAERMPLAFGVEFVTNLLILLPSIWLLEQGRGVDTLLLVVVVAQGVGMTVGLGALVATGLLRPPQNRASLPLGEMVMGAAPFLGLSLTDVLLQRIDILLLSLLGNMQLLGIYSAAYNLVRVAMKVLQSIWRGLYPTLARLYPTSPAQAQRVALRLLWMGLALCGAGALLTDVLATPILRFVYAAGRGATDATEIVAAAPALAVLIWQAPLFFAELYATTWLLVVQRADSALRLALVHLLLLLLLLPLGAMVAGAVGAACGTVAAQVVASTVALWRVWQISMQIEPR